MSTSRNGNDNFSLTDLPHDMLKTELYPRVINLKSIQAVIALAETCKMLYQLFQSQLDQYAAEKLIEYIISSEPPLSEEEEKIEHISYQMHMDYLQMSLNISLSRSFIPHSQFFPPKKEQDDINLNMAKKMIAANPRIILTEDLDNKYDRYSDATTSRHTPFFIASHKGKHKISMFMFMSFPLTNSQIEENPNDESTSFKYDCSVD